MMDWKEIPPQCINECAQLVKHNSISGTKLKSTNVVYTPWENLHKRADMAVGQIGYHDTKKVTKILVEKDKEIIKRMEKTREEKEVDLAAKRKKRDRKVIRMKKREQREKLEA